MFWGGLKAGGALVEMTVDMNVSEFPTLKAGLIVVGMVIGQRCIMITASPPDLGVDEVLCSSWIKEDKEMEGVEFLEAMVASLAMVVMEASFFRYWSKSLMKLVMPN